MAFVALYAERAEQSEPATWRGLREPRVAKTVSELWGRAEQVMTSSCGIPNFGNQDKSLIRQFCQRGPQASLQKILGRPPVFADPRAELHARRGARKQAPRGYDADRQFTCGEASIAVGAAALGPEIDGAARRVGPGRQDLRHAVVDRMNHADEFGVDARHVVNVDDRLDRVTCTIGLMRFTYLVRYTS